MYADQASGLGPEVALFNGNLYGEGHPGYPTSDASHEKWINHLVQWDEDGRPGGKPPGVGDAAPPLTEFSEAEAGYDLWAPRYLLRPEVCISKTLFYLFKV